MQKAFGHPESLLSYLPGRPNDGINKNLEFTDRQ